MAKLGLKTGMAAFDYSNEGSDKINFFKNNVKYTFLKKNVDVTGIILPAFDPTYNEHDPARLTSVGGYRQDFILEDESHADFTSWLIPIQVYTYFGKAYHMIVSPLAAKRPDPIDDLRRYITFECKSDTELQRLVKKPEGASMNDKLALPNYATMGFMNVWSNPSYVPKDGSDSGEDNRVLILSYTASMQLKDDLNKPRPAAMEVLDPNNPNYLFGDVTNPATALRFHTTSVRLSNKREATCLSLGREGRGGVYTVEHATITDEMLSGRIDCDDDDVLNIPSYEQLVELLIEEGNVPYDLIAKVCSKKYIGAFPRKPANTTYSTAQQPARAESDAEQEPAAKTYNTYAPASAIDEDDDIDYSPSPQANTAPVQPQAAPTPAAPASTGSSLTEEEQAELSALTARFSDPANNLTIDEIRRYQALRTKAAH